MTYKIMIAIYIRVSTQEQAAEGYSISEQTERLTKYAEAHDWTIYKTYTDPGYSGGSLDRPAMQDLIKDAAAGRINKVLVYKLDRLSRSQKDTLYLIEDVFIKNNVDFVSMTENFDTGTPFGRAMIGILSVFAQLEREQIKERMQLGADARAKDGYYFGGGKAVIGYDYQNGELHINEYEALQIRKIYEMTETGISARQILKYLNDHGYKTKHGKWQIRSVRQVLISPLYAGKIQWKNNIYPGRHEAIIDPERFDRMQTVLNDKRSLMPSRQRYAFTYTTLLGGMIFCENCGARYYCRTINSKNKVYRYYACYSVTKVKKEMIKDPNCKNKMYRVEELNNIIIGEIKKLALDPDRFAHTDNVTEDKNAEERQLLQIRITELEKKVDKLIELYISGVNYEKLNEKIQMMYDEKSKLEKTLEELNDTTAPELSLADADNMLNSFAEIMDAATEEELSVIVHALIHKIGIDGDNINIYWKFV